MHKEHHQTEIQEKTRRLHIVGNVVGQRKNTAMDIGTIGKALAGTSLEDTKRAGQVANKAWASVERLRDKYNLLAGEIFLLKDDYNDPEGDHVVTRMTLVQMAQLYEKGKISEEYLRKHQKAYESSNSAQKK